MSLCTLFSSDGTKSFSLSRSSIKFSSWKREKRRSRYSLENPVLRVS